MKTILSSESFSHYWINGIRFTADVIIRVFWFLLLNRSLINRPIKSRTQAQINTLRDCPKSSFVSYSITNRHTNNTQTHKLVRPTRTPIQKKRTGPSYLMGGVETGQLKKIYFYLIKYISHRHSAWKVIYKPLKSISLHTRT